ncbi:MAG: cytochrome P450 [Gammaproteobacteria bacterium]
MEDIKAITFTDPKVLECPFPAYRRLRDEAPVHRDPVTGMFVITRYEDCKAIAANPALFSNRTWQASDAGATSPEAVEIARLWREEASPHVDTMQSNDPPSHRKYRGLVDAAFRPTRIEALAGGIETIAHGLIDGFAARGNAEMVSAFSVPLPMYVIADQLGVPRSDRDDFKRWSDALLVAGDLTAPAAARLPAVREVVKMHRYLAERVEHFRAQPADNIISDLAAATYEGRALEMPEIVSILQQLLVAGNETTTNTIAMGLELMIREGLEPALRAAPERIPDFVEEVLRRTCALQGLWRRAVEDTELHGVAIPKGAILMLRWGSANMDERKFPDPERFDMDRTNVKQHLTFGFGIHYCVGNVLARTELRVAFATLLARLSGLRLAAGPDAVQRVAFGHAWGLSRLAVEFSP